MKISVIIPSYKEQDTIVSAVNGVLRLARGTECEIIIADATPGTGVLQALAGSGAIVLTSPKGRGSQMNSGAAKATGDILLFLHADTLLPENAFDAILRALVSGLYSAGAFRLEIDSAKPWLRFIAWTANIRNYFTGTPYGDQAIFVRREFFRKLGGYLEIPIMEDLDFMERVRAHGGKIVILSEAVRTSPRRWETEGMLATTLMHNALRLLRLSGAAPEKLVAFRLAPGLTGKLKVLCASRPVSGEQK
ncbi:MAG: hypothetical protein AUJ51_09890 [Elusimicrobia bacterium CG1_02_56_21]|nr:MAG: hypothetical protein AUJ51_09890 [Elusimicrobia bacterium CG1_02_56_21]